MADDSKLIIGIDGDTKGVEKALANTEKSAKQMANQLASEYRRAGLSQSAAMTKAWKEIEKQGLTSVQRLQVELHKLEKIGSLAVAGLAAGFSAVGAGLAASVNVGAGFEHQMSAVEAISGATADQMTRLTAKAQEMGETSAFTATQAGQAFQFMAQAGWNTEQMLGGIEGIMDLAAASGQDLASTSDIVTDALTAFGLAASDAGRFSDVLAKTSAKSNTDVAKMGYTFKYVAPLAGALQYSIEDTAVAIGLMANAGIKGEQAGTALRGIFTRLVKPTKDSEAAIEALGLSVTNIDGTMKPLSDVINQMRKSFAGLTDEQKAMYAAMLGGQEAMSGLLAVVNASEQDFVNLTREINNAAGSAKEMADIRLDNLTGQFTLFMSALEGVGINIYNNISKPLTDSVRSGTAALGVLNRALSGNMAQSLTRMGESLGRIFDGFVSGLSAALPTILTVLATTLDVIVSVGSTIIDVFTEAYEWADRLTESFGGIDTVLVALIAGFATLKAQMVLTAAIAAFQQLGGAIGLATKAQLLLNAAMTANPIGLIVTAIGTLVGALVYLYETNEKAKLIIQLAWQYIKKAIFESIDAVLSKIQTFINYYDDLLELVGQKPTGIKLDEWMGESIESTTKKIQNLKQEYKALTAAMSVGGSDGLLERQKGMDEAAKRAEKLLASQNVPKPQSGGAGGIGGGTGGVTGKSDRERQLEQETAAATRLEDAIRRVQMTDAAYQQWQISQEVSELITKYPNLTAKVREWEQAQLQALRGDIVEDIRRVAEELSRLSQQEETPDLKVKKDIDAAWVKLQQLKTDLASVDTQIIGGGGTVPTLDPEVVRAINAETAQQAGKGFAEDMSKGIESGSVNLGNGISTAIQGALSGEKTWGEAFADMGKNLLTSLADSMMDTAFSVLSAAINSIVGYIADSFSSGFGIASPSKMFAEFGMWNMAGLGEGMADNAKLAIKPISDLKNSMSSLMGGIDLGSVSASLSPQLSPVMAGVSGGGNVYVNTINKASDTKATTTEQRKANGDIEITTIIESTVSRNIAEGGSIMQAINAHGQSQRIDRG